MKRFLVAGAVALAAMAGTPSVASAAPFTGTIDYVGLHTSNVADLTLATSSKITLAVNVAGTGSFAAIPFGAALTHASPIVYRPVPGTPYLPLWSHAGSGISFNLLTMSIGPGNTKGTLSLFGTGTFTCVAPCVGLDPTPGFWNMTLNNAGVVKGSFSSSGGVLVPEPASLALFGLGLFGAALAARRRRNRA